MPTEKQLANLRSFSKQSANEVRESGRKGGINSGKTRRFKREMRKILEKKAEDEGWAEKACEILFKLIQKGNMKAIEFFRDTMGQKPVDKIETIEKIKIKKVFITDEMSKKANDFIDKFING